MQIDGYGDSDLVRLRAKNIVEDPRPPFARDYDRLIYSPAFRRLQGKTQVVSPGEADFFRTRLTHTIEVAQVARRLAEDLNRRALKARMEAGREPGWRPDTEQLAQLPSDQHLVDPDLCEAAAILHDLGHPPFGHAGETALGDAILRLTGASGDARGDDLWVGTTSSGFNGNAQSFRLAVTAIQHKHGQAGLQLTRATVDASLKYPWRFASAASRKSRRSWNVDVTEEKVFLDQVRADVPDELRHEQTIEAQIMDWADDIAYSVHDLDDWMRAGYMPIWELVNDEEARQAFGDWIVERRGLTHADEIEALHKELHHLFGLPTGPFLGFRRHTEAANPASDEASQATRIARGQLFAEFTRKAKIVKRDNAPDGAPRRYLLRLTVDGTTRIRNGLLKELLWRYVVLDHRMATQQHGQRRVVSELFDAYWRAARDGSPDALSLFPAATAAAIRATEVPDERLHYVIDYVSGMTDAYALARHERMFGGGGRLHGFA